jgi:signal transduction histidine kinase
MPQITIDISDEMMAFLEERAGKFGESPALVLEQWVRYTQNLFDLRNVHDIRSSITAVKGFTSILFLDGAEGLYFTEEDKKGFQSILIKECDHLRYILDNCFPVGQINNEDRRMPPNFTIVVIRDILADAVRRFDNHALRKENHHIQWEVESAVPLAFYADADKLNQIFSNLIGNAIKYSPQGGLIQIKGRVLEESKQVEFSIRDEGLGMTLEFIPRIGECLLQADNRESREMGGSGLGLFIIKQSIEAHNGKLWAHSDGMGKGSIFFFTLSLNLGHNAVATRMLEDTYLWNDYMKQYKEAILAFQSDISVWQATKTQPLDAKAKREWNEAKWATIKAGKEVIHFTHEIDYYLYRLNHLSLEDE